MNIPLINLSEKNASKLLKAFEEKKKSAQGLSFGAQDNINESVREIISDVYRNGDSALLKYTEKFDKVSFTAEEIRVEEKKIDAAFESLSTRLIEALETSADRIRTFQESILHANSVPIDTEGRKTALRYLPVNSAAICVPGASASLASSVLMNVVPAVSAGVKRVVMITPPGKDGQVSADRLAAARIAGVDEIYRVFGPQAIAAVSLGTETIEPVDFIAGPGNIYVATAKKLVFGQVGIDMVAGPSEVLIIADETANPDIAAAELLAQAEHTDGSAVLVTNSLDLAKNTEYEINKQLESRRNHRLTLECLKKFGCIILCQEMKDCVDISNRLAPEHLVVMCDHAEKIAGDIFNAGAIFLGHYTPVAVGDYIAGPSHTLPTGTTARFTGGLTANHFLKSNSMIRYTQEALRKDAEKICIMAEAEGLPAHAESTRKRL